MYLLVFVLVSIGFFVLTRIRPMLSLQFAQLIISALSVSLILQSGELTDSELPVLLIICTFCVLMALVDIISSDNRRSW